MMSVCLGTDENAPIEPTFVGISCLFREASDTFFASDGHVGAGGPGSDRLTIVKKSTQALAKLSPSPLLEYTSLYVVRLPLELGHELRFRLRGIQ